ncbi:MAG: exosortase/archaeosortase family protein [Phycisphaerae bacterium]
MSMSSSAAPNQSAAPPAYHDDLAPSLVKAIGTRGLIQAGILGALLLAVFWVPLRMTVLYRWQHDADWSHGWLVPLFSLYFLNSQREKLAAAQRRPSYVGLLVIIFSLAVYFWTIWVRPVTYARPLCLISTMGGLTLFLGGWKVLRIAWFPIAFLILAVPLPGSVYVGITMPLQKTASVVVGTLLSTIPDLQTAVSGVVIDYNYRGQAGSLNVEQACSGMRLTMAFVTLGVAMAYLGERPVWHRMVMVVSCLPIAVACNIIRVSITGLLFVFKDQPIGQAWHFKSLGSGTPHALLGIALLPLALGLFALVGWVLSSFLIEDQTEEEGTEARRHEGTKEIVNPQSAIRNPQSSDGGVETP